MRVWVLRGLIFPLVLLLGWGIAQAQYSYRPPARAKSEVEQDSFDRSISLKRFRKGNPGWDTQELIASGLAALHREHLQILEELKELRSRIDNLEE